MKRKPISQKREAEMQQLINDIAEDCNMGHWKRQDLIDCINYQQDLLTEFMGVWGAKRARAILKLTELVKVLAEP